MEIRIDRMFRDVAAHVLRKGVYLTCPQLGFGVFLIADH